MRDQIAIFDDILPDPYKYRDEALSLHYRSFHFDTCDFHGIAIANTDELNNIVKDITGCIPTLSFFRKSPSNQQEPHYIHTDVDMGEWSSILYLNPNPPTSDGTSFWTHKETGEISNTTPHLRSEEGKTDENWARRLTVKAVFNRLLVFPSTFYHSRSIYNNWGEGDESRLTQVVFCQGRV